MKSKKRIYALAAIAVAVAAVAFCLIGLPNGTDSSSSGQHPRKKGAGPGRPAASVAESVRGKLGGGDSDEVVEVEEVENDREVKVSVYSEDVAGIAADIYSALSGNDEKKVRELMRQLARFRKRTLLSALRGLIRHGTAEQRRNALYALALAFGEGVGKIRAFSTKEGEVLKMDWSDLGTISDGEPEMGTSEEQAAQISHEIVNAVGEGLCDEDASVKQAAFETMRALAEEESGILSQQLLSGDDSAMKQKLLEDVAGATSDQDLKISIAALGSEDAAVRSLAERNIKAASGKDLTRQEDALAWLEARTDAAIKRVESEGAEAGDASGGNSELKMSAGK